MSLVSLTWTVLYYYEKEMDKERVEDEAIQTNIARAEQTILTLVGM